MAQENTSHAVTRPRNSVAIERLKVKLHKTHKTRALKKNTVPHTSLGVSLITSCAEVGPSTPSRTCEATPRALDPEEAPEVP